jgi:hypothetical protein
MHIDVVIGMKSSPDYPSMRSFQTAKIISGTCNSTITYFAQDEENLLTASVLDHVELGNNVLIVWNHSFIPSIASKLVQQPGTVHGLKWNTKVYDKIWRVNVKLQQIVESGQSLMFGDDPQSTLVIYGATNPSEIQFHLS